jgi:hypothetical protein
LHIALASINQWIQANFMDLVKRNENATGILSPESFNDWFYLQ